jgi:hypothetical protein
MSGHRKDVQKLLRKIIKEGGTVEKVPNGHWKVTNPDTGQACQVAFSPRDHRYVYNAATRLKRIGFLK